MVIVILRDDKLLIMSYFIENQNQFVCEESEKLEAEK